MSELKHVDCLPTITAEERKFLHYNPNTQDVVDWVVGYALASIEEWNRRAQPAAPSVAPEPVAWTTLIEIDWVKRNAGRAGSFYAVKGGPNIDIPLFAHPPRAPLTDAEIDAMWRVAYQALCDEPRCSFDWFEAGVRALEQAHGIGGK